jgi:hypothetical protein
MLINILRLQPAIHSECIVKIMCCVALFHSQAEKSSSFYEVRCRPDSLMIQFTRLQLNCFIALVSCKYNYTGTQFLILHHS